MSSPLPMELDPYLSSEFCVACGLGDLDKVKDMARQQPALVSTCDYDARSPLHVAVAEQHAAVVEFLLRSHADVNVLDRWYASPLQDAIRVHNDHLIQLLKSHGAKPPNKDIAFELLCKAAARGDVPLIRRCAENGADIAAADYDQRTVLHIAASNGHLGAVEYLIQHKAPVCPRDRWGRTPLLDAVTNEHDAIVEVLRAAGGDIGDAGEIATALGNAAARGDIHTIRRLAGAGAKLDSVDYDKRSALHIAAANGELEIVKFLVEAGANFELGDRWGSTPLSEAAHHDKDAVVEFLKQKGATMGDSDLRDRRKKFIGVDAAENHESLDSRSIGALLKLMQDQWQFPAFHVRALVALEALLNQDKQLTKRSEFLENDGVDTVTGLMVEFSFSPEIQRLGASILRILGEQDDLAAPIVNAGGIRICIDTMRNRDVETIQLVIGALSNITFPTCAGAETAWKLFAREGGIKVVTQVLSQYANSTRTVLLSKAAALVWNICGIPSNVVRVEKERTMEELLRVWKFHANNAELVGNCAGACSVLIRKPSLRYQFIESLRGGDLTISMIEHFPGDPYVVSPCVCILAGLCFEPEGFPPLRKTVGSILNRKSSYKHLCFALRAHADAQAIQENIATIFLLVTSKAENAAAVYRKIKQNGGKKSLLEAHNRFPQSAILADCVKQLQQLDSTCINM